MIDKWIKEVHNQGMNKAEAKRRLQLIREGIWNESILVFLDHELYAHRVRVHPSGTVIVLGYDRGNDDQIRDAAYGRYTPITIDPDDVRRVVH